MKLRIVTPTLGQSPWLNETLASAVLSTAQTECIVVAPSTQCRPLATVGDFARILPQSGTGLYDALNDGFRAPGDWSLGTWINDDDRLLPKGFSAALAALERRQDLAAVFGRVKLIDANGRCFAKIPIAHSGDDLGPLLAAGLVPLAQPGMVFRREMFERLGGFDDSLRSAGDMEFVYRALVAGYRFGFVDAWLAEFRVHSGQITQQVDVRHRETAAIVTAARAVPDWICRAHVARWRFRWNNLGAYADRLRRHGFLSMERLTTRK
jgi:GT2 family glycosyltransferase